MNNVFVLFLSSVFVFYLENRSTSKQKKGAHPIIRTNINLSIPNIIMIPSLDEVQQTLNKAVDSIVKAMKGVRQWSMERISKVGVLTAFLRTNGEKLLQIKNKCFSLIRRKCTREELFCCGVGAEKVILMME